MGKTLAPARGVQPNEPTSSSLQAKRRKHHSLMGQVLDLRRLRAAYEAVRRNHGDPGVDGVTVEAFGENLDPNLEALTRELRGRTYQPQPVRRVWIDKLDGGQRPLGIPTVRDRVVQQAVLQVLEPIFEAEFSPHSHGFRPAGESTSSGHNWRESSTGTTVGSCGDCAPTRRSGGATGSGVVIRTNTSGSSSA